MQSLGLPSIRDNWDSQKFQSCLLSSNRCQQNLNCRKNDQLIINSAIRQSVPQNLHLQPLAELKYQAAIIVPRKSTKKSGESLTLRRPSSKPISYLSQYCRQYLLSCQIVIGRLGGLTLCLKFQVLGPGHNGAALLLRWLCAEGRVIRCAIGALGQIRVEVT